MDGVNALLFPLLRILGVIAQDVPRVKLVGRGAKPPNLALSAFGIPPTDSSLLALVDLLEERRTAVPVASDQQALQANMPWTPARLEDYLRLGVWRFVVRASPATCWRLISSMPKSGAPVVLVPTAEAMDPTSIRAHLLDLPLRPDGAAVFGLGRGTIRDAVAAAVVNRSRSPDR